MNEKIICPHCQGAFSISEEDYAHIAEQVRTKEFDKELGIRVEEMKKILRLTAEKENLEQLEQQKQDYEHRLDELKDQLAYYRDLRLRVSTKMIGETLEQHCENSFEKVRQIGFQSAQFGKDNDAKDGSKGDYIFRDFDEDGTEYISVMFEMKNEMEDTEKKHKNADFFKKLDADRRAKNCEYAVLVTMLEADNELYNEGIVDVSHQYPKMYVIRPQFFIPMITLLRNMARNTLDCRRELKRMREQSVDVENFEAELDGFKDYINKNYTQAGKKFDDAIDGIDDAIKKLEAVKAALKGAEDKLRLSDKKASELTIRKLVKNAPSVREMFEALER